MMPEAEVEVVRPTPADLPGGVRSNGHPHTRGNARWEHGRDCTSCLRKQLITGESLQAVEGITVLRNRAAHGSAREITTEQAEEYLALVDAIIYALRTGA